MNNIVHYILESKKYSWEETFLTIKNRERIDWDKVNSLNSNSCELSLMIDSKNYPQKLTEIYMPPFELFYCGNYKVIDSKKVIGIAGSLSENETNELIDFVNTNKLSIAILEKDLSEKLYQLCKDLNLNLIVICKNTITNFKFYKKQYKNLLLISETGIEDWNRSEEQTYERILFSVSNFIYIKTNNIYKLISLHLNTKFRNKHFFVKKNFKLSDQARCLFKSNELFFINTYDDIHHIC